VYDIALNSISQEIKEIQGSQEPEVNNKIQELQELDVDNEIQESQELDVDNKIQELQQLDVDNEIQESQELNVEEVIVTENREIIEIKYLTMINVVEDNPDDLIGGESFLINYND
ncbi:1002_t:CDS:2, partial [Scutellospora calospora]